MSTTKSSASELTRLINQLRIERQHHLDSITEIDQTFHEFGITIPSETPGKASTGGKAKAAHQPAAAPAETPSKPAKRGPRAQKTVSKSPWHSKFPVTGDELILQFVKDKGSATTEEIRKHWEGSGRRGKAENNLTNLVKAGKLKRTKLEGKPGSSYSLP